jgi:hypothetical protein
MKYCRIRKSVIGVETSDGLFSFRWGKLVASKSDFEFISFKQFDRLLRKQADDGQFLKESLYSVGYSDIDNVPVNLTFSKHSVEIKEFLCKHPGWNTYPNIKVPEIPGFDPYLAYVYTHCEVNIHGTRLFPPFEELILNYFIPMFTRKVFSMTYEEAAGFKTEVWWSLLAKYCVQNMKEKCDAVILADQF